MTHDEKRANVSDNVHLSNETDTVSGQDCSYSTDHNQASHPEGHKLERCCSLSTVFMYFFFFLTDLYMDPNQPAVHYKVQELLAGINCSPAMLETGNLKQNINPSLCLHMRQTQLQWN